MTVAGTDGCGTLRLGLSAYGYKAGTMPKRRQRPRSLVDIVRRGLRRVPAAIMVLHTTQGHNRPGVSDLTGLAEFFKRVEADSTFGVDQEGNRIRMRPDADRPWTQGKDNDRALSIEQVGFAESTKRYWIRDYHNGLRTVAEILADWSIKHKIPLRLSKWVGVCGHVHISGPGGHWDPGPNYPYQYVIAWARYVKLYKQGRKRRAKKYARKVLRVQRAYGIKNPTTWYRR